MEKNKLRLDVLVSKRFNISRTVAKEAILNGLVKSNDKVLDKPKLLFDEDIGLTLEEVKETKKEINELIPSSLTCEIVYEDDFIFVVNKPSGLIVHPTNYESNDTLANIMKRIFSEKKIPLYGDYLRNGIVHRLDKDTSGLLIVAKNQKAYDKFSQLIQEKVITRKYLALMNGFLKTKKVEVQAPILRIDESNRREVSTSNLAQDATTIFEEVKRYKNFSLVECTLITGRTHQIRVHAEYINNNVLNDPIYGVKHHNKRTKYGQYLVAYKLEFKHPFLKNKDIKIEIDLPKEFQTYIKNNG